MEKSKRYKEVLALGRLLVKELDLEKSVDTLGKWMAHHISELIIEAEEANGDEKSDIEDRCRGAILALWDHVSVFPRGHRPLDNIEPILATIQALDPQNKAYFHISEAESLIKKSTLSDNAKEWLDMSMGIDYSARLLISLCLQKAANEINEKNQELLELVRSLDADTPKTFVVRFMTDKQEQSDAEQKKEVIREQIETFKERREQLKTMVEMSERLFTSIDAEIESLKQSLQNNQ
ncbi:hypothetical protein KAR34_00275 [bacterium]|nr:hypothetical protein [bacterium]